jgi:hypothetical protein
MGDFNCKLFELQSKLHRCRCDDIEKGCSGPYAKETTLGKFSLFDVLLNFLDFLVDLSVPDGKYLSIDNKH